MLFFITSIQTKSLNYIKYPKAHQMATTHNELQQQYFALLNKHKKYFQVMEEFRQVNRALTREVHNLEALDDVVYSADYQSKIDQALLNYEQYQALQREYDQVQKEEKIKAKELELAKVHNDKLRQKINQLNFEVRLTQKRESIFWEKQKLITKFWQKYEANLEQSAQQISRLKSQHPLQQSMWLRLAKQRIRNMLQVERQQSGMKNEEELGFVQSERFYRLIARKTRQVEEQAIKMQAQLRALKENQITIQQFKIQNDLVSKTFGFESLSDQNDDKQELSIQEQRLQRQIMHISEQISKQSQKTERLQVNLDIEARSGAINKTIDYLKHEKVEMQENLGMIEEVLAAVDIGGDSVAKQQVKQIREEMKRIKYEMEMLQNEVKTTPVIVYSQ